MDHYQPLPEYLPPYENLRLADNAQYGYDNVQFEYVAADGHTSHAGSPYATSLGFPTPPMPMSSTSDAMRRTRSGRPLARSDSPHESVLRSGSPKKRRGKPAKTKMSIPELPGPLSIITEDSEIPVRDMEAWVNRPLEDRQKESRNQKGYVARPMNSFMLYRSAYSERTKDWGTANNHQVVSSVSGASWRMEPQRVRDFYNGLSKIERERHQLAFPDYKFTPAKPGNTRKRKGTEDSDDENSKGGNVTDDPDGDWAATHGVRNRNRSSREPNYVSRTIETSQVPEMTPDQYYASLPSAYGPVRPVSRQTPHMYPVAHGGQMYYPMPVQQHQLPIHNSAPPMYYHQHHPVEQMQSYDEVNSGFIGLPGGSHHELGQYANPARHLDVLEPTAAIDPSLMTNHFTHNPGPPTHNTSYLASYPEEYPRSYSTTSEAANLRIQEWQNRPASPPNESEFDAYWQQQVGGLGEDDKPAGSEASAVKQESKDASILADGAQGGEGYKSPRSL